MSTKIYNGFRLDGYNLLDDVPFFVDSIRQDLVTLADNQWAENLLSMACFEYDLATMEGMDLTENFYHAAYDKMINQNTISKNQGGRSPFDFGCELSFGRVRVGKKFSVIGSYWMTDEKMVAKFNSYPVVKSFYYYDNTDPPEDVTPLEWKQRERAWENLVGYNTFAEKMFLIQIVEPYSTRIMTKELLVDNLPTFEQRLDTLARDYTIKLFEKTLPAELSTGQFANKLYEYYTSEKFADDKIQKKEECRFKLKENLELRDLNGGRE